MNECLAELKRRRVVRVAVLYAATAFVVPQAADLILPRLGVPEWAMSLIVVLLLTEDETLHLAHVGLARAYLCHGNLPRDADSRFGTFNSLADEPRYQRMMAQVRADRERQRASLALEGL